MLNFKLKVLLVCKCVCVRLCVSVCVQVWRLCGICHAVVL